MRHFVKLASVALALSAFVALPSCKKDKDNPGLQVAGTVSGSNYTAGGTLGLQYSTDGGTTFSSVQPTDLAKGSVVKVRVTNGTSTIGTTDFILDWSASNPKPTNSGAEIAEFTVTEGHLNVTVSVLDKMELVATNNATGKFYALNKTTGAATEAFTTKLNGVDLKNIRSFVYHVGSKSFYAGMTQVGGGKLYAIDPATKAAKVINDNPGSKWDGIAGMVVAPEDKLLTTMYYNGQSLTSFTTEGTISTPVKLTGASTICCGMGLVMNSSTEVLVGDYSEYDYDAKIRIYKAGLNGAITQTLMLEPANFGTLAGAEFFVRSMVRDEKGDLYGIVYTRFGSQGDSHLVKIDLAANKVTSIAKIGLGNANQFFGLAVVPAYTF